MRIRRTHMRTVPSPGHLRVAFSFLLGCKAGGACFRPPAPLDCSTESNLDALKALLIKDSRAHPPNPAGRANNSKTYELSAVIQ
jgi:hypothetical protein